MKGCSDDLCLGGGCMAYRGAEPPLTICDGCGQYVPIDGSSHDVFRCECDPDEEWDRDEADRNYEADNELKGRGT